MGYKTILLAAAGILACGWYLAEPWTLTFIDDGPYYSREYPEPVANLALHSKVQLRRFGRLVYILESRSLPAGDESVIVLRDSTGIVLWARQPLKPDGELGAVQLRRANLTWYLGWRVRITPSNQESGDLYLGFFGGFRFYNHSW